MSNGLNCLLFTAPREPNPETALQVAAQAIVIDQNAEADTVHRAATLFCGLRFRDGREQFTHLNCFRPVEEGKVVVFA